MHKEFIIGRQILASDCTVFLTFANAFDLMTFSDQSRLDISLSCAGT